MGEKAHRKREATLLVGKAGGTTHVDTPLNRDVASDAAMIWRERNVVAPRRSSIK